MEAKKCAQRFCDGEMVMFSMGLQTHWLKTIEYLANISIRLLPQLGIFNNVKNIHGEATYPTSFLFNFEILLTSVKTANKRVGREKNWQKRANSRTKTTLYPIAANHSTNKTQKRPVKTKSSQTVKAAHSRLMYFYKTTFRYRRWTIPPPFEWYAVSGECQDSA